MNKKKKLWILVFVIGFILAVYPLISRIYYRQEAKKQNESFEKEVDKMSMQELKERYLLAVSYNNTLDPGRISDPYTEKEKEGRKAYAKMLEVKEQIGYLEVPKIGQNIPIYAGSGDEILEKGCGHMEGTSLPVGGDTTHSVITAHRGLPTAELFRHLDKVKKGDIFYVHNIKEILAYRVDKIEVVPPWDFRPIMVKKGEDYCTLLTCTPYMINSDRLLVRGHRISYTTPVREREIERTRDNRYKKYFIMTFIILIILLLRIIKEKKTIKKLKDGEKNE